MVQMAMPMNAAASVRTRALWVPREHGAWGMLLVPLATGAVVARGSDGYGALLWFAVAAVSLFWLRTPVESLLGTTVIRARTADERRAAMTAAAMISMVSVAALAAVFWGFQHLYLIPIGMVALLAFALQAVVKNRDRKYRGLAQVIGSIGLTSTAASAYYLVSGRFDSTAIVLWALNWMLAAEQIEFVQMRLKGARLETTLERFGRGRAYLAVMSAALGITVLMSARGIAPALTAVMFTPAIARAGLWFRSRQQALDVHKLGWLELVNATVSALIMVAIFRAG